jgi:hypothetical protein
MVAVPKQYPVAISIDIDMFGSNIDINVRDSTGIDMNAAIGALLGATQLGLHREGNGLQQPLQVSTGLSGVQATRNHTLLLYHTAKVQEQNRNDTVRSY